MVKRPEVARWYEAKKAKDQGRGKKALVAVMRKLSLAVHAVGARGETFDPGRLFPGKPLVKRVRQATSAVGVSAG